MGDPVKIRYRDPKEEEKKIFLTVAVCKINIWLGSNRSFWAAIHFNLGWKAKIEQVNCTLKVPVLLQCRLLNIVLLNHTCDVCSSGLSLQATSQDQWIQSHDRTRVLMQMYQLASVQQRKLGQIYGTQHNFKLLKINVSVLLVPR